MPRPTAAHAGFRGGAGARRSRARSNSGKRRGADRRTRAGPTTFDLAALADAATRSGNLAIPLVKALTATVAKVDAEAARYVHWGATSQDVIDTALCSGCAPAIDALLADIDRAIAGFARLARQAPRHRRRRPHLAAARAADAVRTQARRIRRGAAPLAQRLKGCAARRWRCNSAAPPAPWPAFGDNGLMVAEGLAAELKLPLPDAPWHTHRDRIAEVASVFAILAGTCGKIARDVVADDADRCRRSLRARGRRPRRLLDDAAQAQSGRGRRALAAATMAPNLAATIFAARSRTTSAAPAPGMRNGRRCRR